MIDNEWENTGLVQNLCAKERVCDKVKRSCDKIKKTEANAPSPAAMMAFVPRLTLQWTAWSFISLDFESTLSQLYHKKSRVSRTISHSKAPRAKHLN